MRRFVLALPLLLLIATACSRETPPPRTMVPPPEPSPPHSQESYGDVHDQVLGERVDAALLWLAHHQAPAGYWDADGFADHSVRAARMGDELKITGKIFCVENLGTEDVGESEVDVGLTGLALLAFAEAGQSHQKGAHKDCVRKAMDWLIELQDGEGALGPRTNDAFIYGHAYATAALCEVYALTQDKEVRAPAQKAVDWLVKAQNPGLGWRYGMQPGDNDSSVTADAILALHAAERAGLKFPLEEVYSGANKWFDLVISKDYDGDLMAGYRGPGMRNARLTSTEQYDRNGCINACAIFTRIATEEALPSDRREIAPLSKPMTKELPQWTNPNDPAHHESSNDMYYWYMGSLALALIGGDAWDKWEQALSEEVLIKHQRGFHILDIRRCGTRVTKLGDADDAGCWRLDEHGSFDPIGAWGGVGGRIYSTALGALTLQCMLEPSQ